MRIDAHHHLWRYDPAEFGWIDPSSCIARDFSPADLERAMDACGVDGAIAVQARQSEAETAFLLDCAARCPRILGVVGWIDLRAPDIVDRLAAAPAGPLLGYRHVVQDEPDPGFLLGDAFVAGVAAVVGAGLSYDLLVNRHQLADVPRLLDRVGAGRFVLDHAAKPDIAGGGWQPWADSIAAAAAYPQLWCKVSGLVTEARHDGWVPGDFDRYLDHLFDCFGPDRLIWGSDWPVCELAARYEQTFDVVAAFVDRRCPSAKVAILGTNATQAYPNLLSDGARSFPLT
jgi:predicted TIM-barrel fold metal-dependent hydrolase